MRFNPPNSKNVKTNVANSFLAQIDKASILHKIFNKELFKVCYSCMPNAKSTISNHNRRVLNNNKTTINEKTCNCRAKSGCSLDGRSLTASVVYKAEIAPTDTQESKVCIEITEGPFKERYSSHKKSLTTRKIMQPMLGRKDFNLEIKKGQNVEQEIGIFREVPP